MLGLWSLILRILLRDCSTRRLLVLGAPTWREEGRREGAETLLWIIGSKEQFSTEHSYISMSPTYVRGYQPLGPAYQHKINGLDVSN